MSSERKGKQQRKTKKKNPILTFFKIVFSIVLAFVLAAGCGVYAYVKLSTPTEEQKQNIVAKSGKDTSFMDALIGRDIKLNVAVFGVDGDGTRTDVMFVVHFDSKKKSIGLISLPRDTRITLTDEVIDRLEEDGRNYNKTTKLNAVHSYSGKEKGCENAVLQIEDLLGISIDHYVKVDLDGFRKIVDVIDGVEMEVPQNMDYEDPYQDLYIHLKAGYQTLNGDKAEQLVRYRSYRAGDVARVQVQQLFLNAFAKKVLSTETILKNLPSYIQTYYDYVTTDISISDALKYANYIDKIDMNNIKMETLPGEGQYVNDVSYFIHDPEETQEVVDIIFYGKTVESDGDIVLSKDKKIEVANGGYTQGLAGRISDKLKLEGYNVTDPTTYTGTKTEETRIFVSEEGIGRDLQKYFEKSKIIVDSDMINDGTDIRIILGTSQTE